MTSGEIAVFGVGSYGDVASARHDYNAVRDCYYDMGAFESFDAVMVGRQDTGKMKIFKKFERPTLHGGLVGAGWGLATGLAMTLFPGAAIGTNFSVRAPGGHGGISALAGHVAQGLGRGDLLACGLMLDAAEAGLIVAMTRAMVPLVQTAMEDAAVLQVLPAVIDSERLDRDIRKACRDAIDAAGGTLPRPPNTRFG